MGIWSSLFGQEKKWNQAMDGKVKYAERKPKRESKKFYTAEDRANLRESRAEEKAQKAQDRDNVKIRNRFNRDIRNAEKQTTRLTNWIKALNIEGELASIDKPRAEINGHLATLKQLPASLKMTLVHLREAKANIDYRSNFWNIVTGELHKTVQAFDAITFIDEEVAKIEETSKALDAKLAKLKSEVARFRKTENMIRKEYDAIISGKNKAGPANKVREGQRFA